MPTIKGRNVLLAINNGTTLDNTANGTSCSIVVNAEMIEKAGTQAHWREYLSGLCDWTMEASGICFGVPGYWMGLMVNGTPVSVATFVGTGTIAGTGLIRSISIEGPVTGMATYKVQIQGTGSLSVY